MKFTAIKANLTDALATVQKAMSSKNTVPILSGIYLRAEDGMLVMTATDMEVRIEATVPVEVIEAGDTVVQGRAFVDLVRRLPDERIVFDNESRDGEDRMTITYGENTALMNGWPGREYPTLPPAGDVLRLSMPAGAFKEAVDLTAFTINPEEIRAVFTGMLFEVRDHRLTLVGTDSFRLALYRAPINNIDGKDHDLIVPVRALNEVARIAGDEEEPIQIAVSEGRMVFEMENVCLTTNLIRGDYPPYERVIPSGYQSYIKINRDLLAATMNRATLFSREKDGTSVVNFVLDNSVLHIFTESEHGQVSEHLQVYHEGEAVDIAFNARFISEALKAMRYEELDVTFNGALGPCIFRPQAEEDYLYLLLPLRR